MNADNDTNELSRRAVSMLRAVRDGRCQITLSCEPDLYVDGIPCCDQSTAHVLARLGLISPVGPGHIGDRAPAIVTEKGFHVLAAHPLPAAS